MTPNKLYSRGISALKPNRDKMFKIHQTRAQQLREIAATVRAEIERGADPRALYDLEPGPTPRRAVLLGVLRRGMGSLD